MSVYAYRREAARHERYAEWLASVLAGDEELALSETALTGFVRIADRGFARYDGLDWFDPGSTR